MTDHTHREIVPGCYRCELGADEARTAIAELLEEARRLEDDYGDNYEVMLCMSELASVLKTVIAERDNAIATGERILAESMQTRNRLTRAEATIAEALDVARSGSVPLGVPEARHFDRLLAETRAVLSRHENGAEQ